MCAAKIALLLAYSDASKTYSNAILYLHDCVGTLTKPEYEGLSRVAEERRAAAEVARLEMEAHISQHGC